MRSTELFRTCANEHVAAAALACIGGRLERRVAAAARRAGVPAGAYVVELLADYDRKASPNSRKVLETDMVRHDMPILAGLRHVVETVLEEGARAPARPQEHHQTDERLSRWHHAGARPAMHGAPSLKPLLS